VEKESVLLGEVIDFSGSVEPGDPDLEPSEDILDR